MVKSLKSLAFIIAGLATGAGAQDFSQGSTARPWNLAIEVPATFEATVVDLLCTFTGDCPADCGAGRRQLGLLRSADDVLVYPNKNSQPAFTGAVQELLSYCGQKIDVDGLMLVDEDYGINNIYLLQKLRPAGTEDWIKANTWTKTWAQANPEAKGKGPWFRRDPRVLAELEKEGFLGLGVAQEEEFVQDWLE